MTEKKIEHMTDEEILDVSMRAFNDVASIIGNPPSEVAIIGLVGAILTIAKRVMGVDETEKLITDWRRAEAQNDRATNTQH